MANKTRKWEISDEEFDRQYEAATKRGKEEVAKGTYAVAARYNKTNKRIVIELANGATLLIPAPLIQGLQAASARDLSAIEILGTGTGLYWPALEVEIGVAGLLEGVFGSRAWMAELEQADAASKQAA